MAHPVRVHALMVLSDRLASPAIIAKELGLEARDVSYHFRVMEKLGLIELVETRETPGGRILGRFYRATARPYFDLDSWREVDPANQPGITANILAMCNADIAAAVKAGTINGEDNHISRSPMVLDRKAYKDLIDLLDRTAETMLSLQQEAAARLRAGDETILTTVHVIQFESPRPVQIEDTSERR
jgi:DNA-binding transcriptional ArsR family regulator